MGSIPEILDYLRFGRRALLESISGLSERELTERPIYESWTIKDVLGHVLGWDRRVLHILPLIVSGRTPEIGGVEVESHNQQAVTESQGKTLAEVLAELDSTYRQIIEFIGSLDHKEIDQRRDRGDGRFLTIRSYVIDIMVEHERRHAQEIEEWRRMLAATIAPTAIVESLQEKRAAVMRRLDRVEEALALKENMVGAWSISDVVGHLADWEALMLASARHIHDPSLPPPQVAEAGVDWNEVLVARRRAGKSWPENYHSLVETQQAVDDFIADLTPGDWSLRGPYPWPNDQGTLAELITHIAEHYDDHLPDFEQLSLGESV